MIPKSVGAVFSIQKKPLGLQFNLGKMAYHNDMPLFKSQWGPHKCQIWLHGGFHGKDPQEIRANARQAILQIAGRLEDKYHTELTAIRWHREEWVDFDIPRSAKIADAAGIPKGGRIEVEGAIHKFSDWSDPDKVQFNPKPQGNGEIPLAHAQIHHKLYSGLYEDKLRELEERQVRALSLMEKLVDGTEKNTEALTAIQQRMNGGLR